MMDMQGDGSRLAENPPGPRVERGALWRRIREVTERGLSSGALQSVETDSRVVRDSGVDFVVRAVPSLGRKDAARLQDAARRDANPFLPYDPELAVGDLTATHVGLLNKYNVVPNHLLIVPRAFEDQRRLLDRADLEAAWRCLAEIDGLVFYNGGVEAGASQAHKHLQWVPFELGGAGPGLPIEPLLERARFEGPLGRVSGLPFAHALIRMEPVAALARSAEARAGEACLADYLRALEAVGLAGRGEAGLQRGPYNLLLTRRWLLLVPRSRESVAGISINALGYAGSLLVRDDEQARALAEIGPLEALRRVGRSAPPA